MKKRSSIIESIISPPSRKVLKDISESLLDTNLNEGLIKEIPIISTILNISKSMVTISDRLLTKKILAFLSELEHQDRENTRKFKLKLDQNSDFQQKIGDKLLYILDKCDDEDKAIYVAKLFRAFLENTIDYTDFLRLSKSIDLLTDAEIKWFLDSKEWSVIDDGKLIAVGLLYQEIVNEDITYDSNNHTYIHVELSPLGEKLKNILNN